MFIALTDKTDSVAAQGEIVTIFVGPEKKRYSIHKDVICHHSEYFRTAYNGRWKEADEGVTLDDVEVGIFNIFVHWLYTQQLPPGNLRGIAYPNEALESHDKEECFYGSGQLRVCAFGNRFLVAELERIAHNNFVDNELGGLCGASYQDIIFAYENLPGHSSILNLMVKLQCHCWSSFLDSSKEKQIRLDLPKAFLVDIMIRQAEIRDKRREGKWESAEDREWLQENFHMQKKTKKVSE
jgi:hypothetical protein